MSVNVGYWSDLGSITLNEKRESWIHAARPGSYKHPVYGVLEFTFDKLLKFAEGVKNKIRGIDIDVDYDHKTDAAMGGRAAGWVRDSKVDNAGLWLLVEWTENAAAAIKAKEYKYFSPEFTDKWTDAAGKVHENVLLGGGITNRPYLKDLLPVNLSELSFAELLPQGDPPKNDPTNPEGVEMKLSELAVLIGLSETATDEEVKVKLTELAKPPVAPTPPAPSLDMPESIKQLAESNPMVGNLVKLFEQSQAQNARHAVLLKEQAVAFKLNELDGAKIALAPALRDQLKEIGLAIPVELSEKFWTVVKKLHEGTSALVQLGEIGGAHVTHTEAPDAVQMFNERIAELVGNGKAADAISAMEMVAKMDPAGYKAYAAAVSIK